MNEKRRQEKRANGGRWQSNKVGRREIKEAE
jgi:hypothetical protein